MALRCLLGGAGISVAAHELLLLTGDTFGISGFAHRGVKGNAEALMGVAGLIIGGVLVAYMERGGTPRSPALNISLGKILFSGFLVGIGTKIANGCTSGHMICGISRLSLRSAVATATFFTAAVVTSNIFYGDMTAPSTSALSSWNLSPKEHSLLLLQAIPFVAVSVSYLQIFRFKSSPTLRALTYFVTSLQFALALRLSDLTEPKRVLGFLLLPLRKGFDSSLLFVAGGSVPLGILLYKFVQAIRSKDDEKKEAAVGCGSTSESRLTAKKGIDGKVIGGSLIFGLGWGMTGICPGTGIMNAGRAIAYGQIISPYSLWIAAMATGGLVAGQMKQ